MVGPDADKSASPWAAHRARAEVLCQRYPFGAEVLGLYVALLDVWQDVWEIARAERPQPSRLAPWAAEQALPRVVKATEAAGPEALATAARDLVEADRLEESLAGWLAGDDLPPVQRYLARASLSAPLVALEEHAGAACAQDPAPRGGQRCPRCGAAPQLSFRSQAEDRLVSGARSLACARCWHTWNYSSSSCPSCGETTGAQRTVYAEQRNGVIVGRDNDDPGAAAPDGADPGAAAYDGPTFPHLRIDACATCERYLIDVDLGRDTRAVPEVDELAALPLALYAADQGLSKITPNLMGF
jgi:FdhE protein